MSVWQFIWNAIWREAGNVTRVIQTIAVTVPFIITLAVGVGGGEWSKDLWPTWVWASITGVAMFLALFWGIASRAYFLEKSRQPNLQFLFGDSRIFRQKQEHGDHVITSVYVGVQNASDDIAVGVTCVLANVVGDNTIDVHDIDKRLLFNDSGGNIENINAHDQKYFKVAKIKQLSVGRDEHNTIVLGPFMDNQTHHLNNEHYILQFRIGSASSPAWNYNLELGLDDNRDLHLNREVTNG